MEKKTLLYLVGGIALVALVAFGLTREPASPTKGGVAEEETALSEPGTPSQAPPQTGAAPAAKPKAGSPAPRTPGQLSILSPSANAEWVLHTNNAIQWSREVGYGGGGLSLTDAATGNLLGWITPTLGPRQTSYTWNTRDVALERTVPQKKDISPGTYLVTLHLDSGTPREVASGIFRIVLPTQVTPQTTTLTIQNFTLTPATLTATRGTKIQVINSDTITHDLKLSNFSTYRLAPGETATIETLSLSTGSYELYSEAYPSIRCAITIR
jgi:plastocyanin